MFVTMRKGDFETLPFRDSGAREVGGRVLRMKNAEKSL